MKLPEDFDIPEGWNAVLVSEEGDLEFITVRREDEDDVPEHVALMIAFAMRMSEGDLPWAMELREWLENKLDAGNPKPN